MGTQTRPESRIARREFLTRGALGVGAFAVAPALLAACGSDDEPTAGTAAATQEARAIVGDVLDFALDSDQWEGSFGFVTLRMRPGVVDGSELWFVRTDASEEGFARRNELVWTPRLAPLADGARAGDAYLVEGGARGQATVMSSGPGRPDYTPAWRVHTVRWRAEPRLLASVAQVAAARRAGQLAVESSGVVMNASVVAWAGGELAVDTQLREALGAGQLLERPDRRMRRVTFKLHQCFPGARYIATDAALAPMADGMHLVHSPRLARATGAGATGRTNVFMNGLEGPGPMGFQPSVFDSAAGDAVWSPYWDHMTYAWKEGADVRVLASEAQVHAARDAGQLDEFPGTPDTGGRTFTVNCPVPVEAPNDFAAG